jgi:flavorubredoxin
MIAHDEMNGKILYEDNRHQLIWLGTDEQENEGVVQTNQYLIIHDGRATLLDPGGVHLFARVASAVSRYVGLEKIESIVFSHQDPDVSSGIALWMGVTKAKIYISELWIRFLPHFGIVDLSRISSIEASGGKLPTETPLRFIPAHFLHSTGNFTSYDSPAKTVFSADIGAAVFSKGGQSLFVEDFEQHVKLMDGFHRRYMTANKVLRKWVELVSREEVAMIAPQHGAIFSGSKVSQFLSWLKELECGIDLLESLYRV